MDEFAPKINREIRGEAQQQAGTISQADRRASIQEQIRNRANRLREEADQLDALASHLPPALDSDFQARRALENILFKSIA